MVRKPPASVESASALRNRPEPLSIGIVGAGIGGIAMGVALTRAGFGNFTIFEAEPGVGGTWRVNNYPGSSVDLPSMGYSFSFNNRNWTGTHANQPELLEYLEDSARRFGLYGHLRLNTTVQETVWDEQTHGYVLITEADERFRFDVVVSAVGLFSDPNYPQWPGLNVFAGVAFHSARWRHDVSLTGQRVAIVGAGSSSAQIIPSIAGQVSQLYVFQREPGWVIPRNAVTYSSLQMARYENRRRRVWRRRKFFLRFEWGFLSGAIHVAGSKRNRAGEQTALDYIDRVFRDRPDLRAAVTPQYIFSGKRRVLSDDYYQTLTKPNVELIPHSVTELTRTGVIDATGTEREIDVLILATGFKAAHYLSRMKVVGRGGRDLQTAWQNGAYALLGMAVPGFPNFYLSYGPGTNGGAPITYNAELQAAYVVRNLRRMQRTGATALDVRPGFVRAYNRWLARRNARTAWARANNYMKGPNGNIITQWPDDMLTMNLLLRLLRRPATRRDR
ncbi:MAG: hypothetical protein JWN95_3641 [Frankiales bacterium]|nr:hypothetical protein [Frankiales bacterium]